MQKNSSAAFVDTKPHYLLLDALRGVAALMVIWYHIFEGFATNYPYDQHINHGYLAVNFFFILSGFVIGYAYDDRWKVMKSKEYYVRRLIRLQPMIVLSAVLGAITFCIQGAEQWDGTKIGTSAVMFALLLTMFLIPVAPGAGAEVRGNGEMYPLNGPSWSLFFEYIGYILYALLLRRLSTLWLTVLTILSGTALAAYAVLNFSGYGHLGVGWTMAGNNFLGGMLNILFAFSMGLLLSRNFKAIKMEGAFWISTLLLVTIFMVPYIGEQGAEWKNGIYDAVCTIVIFPIIILIGASGTVSGVETAKLYKFLGDISYPLYIIHYPFMYLYYAWLWKNGHTFEATWPMAFVMFFGNILIAYAALKLYDEPVRKWLSKRFLSKR